MPKRKAKTVDRTPTRRDDERLLAWLQMRADGKKMQEIATAYGVTKNVVIGALNRIAKEDVAE
jgi:transposase